VSAEWGREDDVYHAIDAARGVACGEQAEGCGDLFHERRGRDAVLGVRCAWEGEWRSLSWKAAWLGGRSDSNAINNSELDCGNILIIPQW